jgi:predicted CXXCH cytochrome family protein
MGYKAGHTLKTNLKGFPNGDPTPTMIYGPGGDFPSSQLGCSSCHDPHGNEEFRLLNTTGEVQGSLEYPFVNPAPEALGFRLSSSVPEANDKHTAYRGGMSAWCGNCHGDFHNSGSLLHPSGSAINSLSVTYGLYNGTGNIGGGNPATSYLKEVPFEDAAMDTNSTWGPSETSEVSCMSCHRAHATANQDAGRWDFGLTFLNDDGQVSGWGNINPWANQAWEQRSLCNKCHKKDEHDALNP